MKTYHMYHAETVNAETKLREAERQEGRVKGVSGTGGGVEPVFGLRIEERHQRRNAARKMEKMREKVQSSLSFFFTLPALFKLNYFIIDC